MKTTSGLVSVLFLASVVLLSGCGMKGEASYPTKQPGTDAIIYSDQKPETIWGKGETFSSYFFGDKEDKGSGIGVNSFLWRASLDSLSFMPITSADPFGGVILTDWYENPETPGERFKINIYILDRQLRSDGVRVAVFKQKQAAKGGGWKDAAVDPSVPRDIENTILTRARELRVTQAGSKEK